jgi:hypothetical protein
MLKARDSYLQPGKTINRCQTEYPIGRPVQMGKSNVAATAGPVVPSRVSVG